LLRCRDQHAAARGPVQLGHHQPRHSGHLLEHLDLVQCVLAGGGVEHQHDIVRRRRVQASEHAPYLGELVHQPLLVLEPAGRIDISTSMPSAVAFLTPSNTIAEASPPSGPEMMGTPIRSAQILSCPIAAARKVSPAARRTL
jgi:hypothetical protein